MSFVDDMTEWLLPYEEFDKEQRRRYHNTDRDILKRSVNPNYRTQIIETVRFEKEQCEEE